MDMQNVTVVEPPGFFIREELEARQWNQRDLAYVLGCTEQAVNMLISGKRGISSEMAKALGEAFGVPPEFFANLQNAYDLSRARDPDPGISRRARLQAPYPVREMIKRGWLQDTDATLLEVQMARFFECNSADEIPHMAHAAMKADYGEVPAPQLAWLFRVRQIAKSVSTAGRYSEKTLRAALSQLKQLTIAPEESRHVPRFMAEHGIRYVVVEGLPGGKIDGVCFWLDDWSPVVGMSLRFDRIDNLWFVLRHEIEHVLNRDGRQKAIIDVDLDSQANDDSLPIEEQRANAAAREFCVPVSEMDSFIARKQPFFSERDVLGFARRLQVHPGIVVGQLQRRTGRYELLRRYQAKVRQAVAPGAILDGWGNVAPTEM